MSRKTKNAGPGRISKLVYSTEHGRMCQTCRHPQNACTCPKQAQTPPSDGVVRVARQTKGRKGKGVTLITGVPLPPAELKQLGKQLKKMCGSGGTLKEGILEIQGDHRDKVLEELKRRGWSVKKAGG